MEKSKKKTKESDFNFWKEIKERYFILILALAIIVIGSLIYNFFPDNDAQRINLRFEFVKFLIQLLIIVILGGILIQEYNHSREKAKNLNEFKKSLLTGTVQSYFKVKKARRILEANTVYFDSLDKKVSKKEIPCTVYEVQLIEIIDAQLEFEHLYHQLETFSSTFSSKNIEKLLEQAGIMEKYLNNLIDEYQEMNISFNSSSPAIDITSLKIETEFINSDKFNAGFSDYFRDSVELIQSEILKN